MTTIIRSDMYRLGKGRALKNTIIASIGIVILILAIVMASSTIMQNISTDGMTSIEIAELQNDVAEMEHIQAQATSNAANFMQEIAGESISAFLFLPILLAVFCADFTHGTYKNTLTYESNRTKVYFAKLLLSAGLCILIHLIGIVTGLLLGLVFFGTSGLTMAFWAQLALSLLLQLPIHLAIVCLGHCIISFTKKSGTTIAIYLIGLFALSLILQLTLNLKPDWTWLMLFEPLQALQLMMNYTMLTVGEIAASLGFFSAVAVGSTVLGALHFKKADMP